MDTTAVYWKVTRLATFFGPNYLAKEKESCWKLCKTSRDGKRFLGDKNIFEFLSVSFWKDYTTAVN